MNSPSLIQLEEKINQLSCEEQLLLIERVVHHLRKCSSQKPAGFERQLAGMSRDPEIQKEIQIAENVFAFAESDGLGKL